MTQGIGAKSFWKKCSHIRKDTANFFQELCAQEIEPADRFLFRSSGSTPPANALFRNPRAFPDAMMSASQFAESRTVHGVFTPWHDGRA